MRTQNHLSQHTMVIVHTIKMWLFGWSALCKYWTEVLSQQILSRNTIYWVKKSQRSPFRNCVISAPPSLDCPYILSTKTIGTSPTLCPAWHALTIISIWNAYPCIHSNFHQQSVCWIMEFALTALQYDALTSRKNCHVSQRHPQNFGLDSRSIDPTLRLKGRACFVEKCGEANEDV